MVEDLADVIDGGAGDGDVAAGDAGLGADALGDAAGVGEEGVQHRPGGVVLLAQFVGLFDLPGDLAFADDEAVEAGGDAEQMAHGVGLPTDVEMGPDFFDGNAVELGQEGHDRFAVERRRRPGRVVEDAADVEFDAVAGAEDDGLAVEARGEDFEGAGQLFVAEGEAFADGDGRGAVAAPDGEEVHCDPPTSGCWRTMQTINRPKATMVSKATDRPRRCQP